MLGVGRSMLDVLSLAILITVISTGSSSAAETNAVRRSCCAADFSTATYTDKSIYQVESKWTTDDGKEIALGRLAGKPQVVLMFFANCTYACPILVNDMKRIEAALPETLRTRVGFTLISFDAGRDTSAALADYRRSRDLVGGNWTLLSGKPDDIMELAALLGVRYKEGAGGQFLHSNVITILNAKGEIIHQQTGLNGDISETVTVLKQQFPNP